MTKLITFLLMFGATQALASSDVLMFEEAPTMELMQAGPSELILDALFAEAALEWGTTSANLWNEYRNGLLKVKKLGLDPAGTGDEMYELLRVKTGGSLILILDVQSL